MFNLKKSLVALIAALTLFGVEARGESFVIPDLRGTVWITTTIEGGPPTLRLGPEYVLFGSGLAIWTQDVFSGGNPGSVEARDTCIIPCTPGQVIGTNSSFSGVISSPSWTSANVNGVTYGNVIVTGWLNFVSQPLVLPKFEGDPEVTIPFTFSGELTGNALAQVVNPVFTATLSGQGMARFRFSAMGFDDSNPRYRLESIEYQFVEPFPILIDIKPGTFANSINPNSNGKIPVALLSTDSFDATEVDLATVRFGATGTEVAPVHSATEDVDGDGDLDVAIHFVTQHTGITCGNVSASLRGALFSGLNIKGSDPIEVVPCN